MRVAIVGSRTLLDMQYVRDAMQAARVDYGIVPTVVLCGDAPGIDRLGAKWAEETGIPVEHHPADWALHGQRAGPLRNARMAHLCDAVVAIWDGSSPGTRDMVARSAKLGRRVVLWQISLAP